MAAKAETETAIPDNIKYLTKDEVDRMREFFAQRAAANTIVQATIASAQAIVNTVDREVESLKAHYGVARGRQVAFDLDNKTMETTPE